KNSFCENRFKRYQVWIFKNAFLVLEKSQRQAEVIGTRLHAISYLSPQPAAGSFPELRMRS
ncbi:hypothetical protein, partial [Escherichia coli]|uniref:hypothetical protein n=1 Tax=Escherichia coli TaxID=562 RepID=UPI003EE1238A